MLIGIKMKKNVNRIRSQWPFENSRNPSKIYVNPGIKVNSNDLFSDTTASMILKFYMQHEKVAGLQKNKIQGARESNMATVAKNS